jgi:hypothetical protein
MQMQATPQRQPSGEIDQKTKKIRDADILISLFLIAGCLWTAFESVRMSYRAYMRGFAKIYTAPGLLPLIVSIAIIVCASHVFMKAFRDGGDLKFLRPEQLKRIFSHFHAWTALLIMGLLGLYVFIAIEHLPFTLATFLFVAAFMLIFRATKRVWILVIASLYAIAITYFFVAVVNTRFPVMFLDKW